MFTVPLADGTVLTRYACADATPAKPVLQDHEPENTPPPVGHASGLFPLPVSAATREQRRRGEHERDGCESHADDREQRGSTIAERALGLDRRGRRG